MTLPEMVGKMSVVQTKSCFKDGKRKRDALARAEANFAMLNRGEEFISEEQIETMQAIRDE